MSEEEIKKLLALKRCEQPAEDRLSEVESLFRYNLRLERIREKSLASSRQPLLPSWLIRWSPAAACAALLALGAFQFNNGATQNDISTASSTNPTAHLNVVLAPTSSFISESDPWAGSTSSTPVASPLVRSVSFDATPVAFDESRITF